MLKFVNDKRGGTLFVSRKDDNEWVKKYMRYEVDDVIPRHKCNKLKRDSRGSCEKLKNPFGSQ